MSSGELIDPDHASRDLRLVNAAIRKKWALPDDIKERLPNEVLEILESAEEDGVKLSAARLLLTMVNQNEKADEGKRRKVRTVRHIHTVEPVTDGNFIQRKDEATRRLADLRNNAATGGGGREAAGGSGSGDQPG